MIAQQQKVPVYHSVPSLAIFWTDVVDWAVVTLSFLYTVHLILLIRLYFSRPTSWNTVLDEDLVS